MKPLYRCDWCVKTGTEEEIAEHEKTCLCNTTLRSCHTCLNEEGFLTIKCKKGVEIPSGCYMQNCEKWQEGLTFDAKNFFSSDVISVGGILGN